MRPVTAGGGLRLCIYKSHLLFPCEIQDSIMLHQNVTVRRNKAHKQSLPNHVTQTCSCP
jgi:hypothetical protein